jgi:hypothetical protein
LKSRTTLAAEKPWVQESKTNKKTKNLVGQTKAKLLKEIQVLLAEEVEVEETLRIPTIPTPIPTTPVAMVPMTPW